MKGLEGAGASWPVGVGEGEGMCKGAERLSMAWVRRGREWLWEVGLGEGAAAVAGRSMRPLSMLLGPRLKE